MFVRGAATLLPNCSARDAIGGTKETKEARLRLIFQTYGNGVVRDVITGAELQNRGLWGSSPSTLATSDTRWPLSGAFTLQTIGNVRVRKKAARNCGWARRSASRS
jgi:hypothetical protein